MKFLSIFSLFLALLFVGCTSEDYYDLSEVVSGTAGGGGGDTDGNGFTFKGTFYSTLQMFRQAGIGITFSPPATDNAGGITVAITDEEFVVGTANVGVAGVINITPEMSSPANVEQTQSTGGTVTINSLDTDAKSVDLNYTIETADGNAVGKFVGTYQVQ